MNNKKREWSPLTLMLRTEDRNKFKQITHGRKITMQDVLAAFVDFYIKDPDQFKIKMNVELKING